MTTTNDITNDKIKSKVNSDSYRDNWYKVFGKKPTTQQKQENFEKTKKDNFKHSSRLEGIDIKD